MGLVAVHAGESSTSRTRALAAAALELGGGGELVELSQLPAEGLLGGLVVRAYLAEHRDPRIHRMVMLGVPNVAV